MPYRNNGVSPFLINAELFFATDVELSVCRNNSTDNGKKPQRDLSIGNLSNPKILVPIRVVFFSISSGSFTSSISLEDVLPIGLINLLIVSLCPRKLLLVTPHVALRLICCSLFISLKQHGKHPS